jgi:hypothetical protein
MIADTGGALGLVERSGVDELRRRLCWAMKRARPIGVKVPAVKGLD